MCLSRGLEHAIVLQFVFLIHSNYSQFCYIHVLSQLINFRLETLFKVHVHEELSIAIAHYVGQVHCYKLGTLSVDYQVQRAYEC